MLHYLPEVSSFLVCFKLDVGTKIIAVFHMAASVLVTAMCARTAGSFHSSIGTMEDVGGVYQSWFSVAVAVVCLSVVHGVLAILLFVGANRQWAAFVRTWVMTMIALFVAAMLYNITVALLYGVNASGVFLALHIVAAILFYCMLLYFILTVNSYYLTLENATK